jgi:hypothetical protein
MKLRRYGQFINESVEITDDLINILIERGEFCEELMELDYSRFDFTASYSDMCKKEGRNPKADFLKIQKYFDEKGFTLEKLKYLFSEESDINCGYNLYELYTGDRSVLNREPLKTILSKLPSSQQGGIKQVFSIGGSLDSQNAAVDVYLYFLFEELRVFGHGPVWLGGDGWGNVDLEDDDGGGYSEAFIRYRYGYHQTEYGKLWMEQCGVDEEWFQERAMQDLQNYLTDEFSSIVSIVDISKDMSGLSLSDYSIIEEDRIIIDLPKLVEDINSCPVNRYWGGEKKYVVDEENIAARFTKELEGFHLDIELTDTDDLIIWGRFKED